MDYFSNQYDARRKPLGEKVIPVWAMIVLGTRLLGALIGVVAMLVGIFMAIKVFSGIYTALTGPAALSRAFDEWARALGGNNALEVVYRNQQYPVTRLLTLLILGVGSIVLAHLSLTVMVSGMKLITMASGELKELREALKPDAPEPAPARPAEERTFMGGAQPASSLLPPPAGSSQNPM